MSQPANDPSATLSALHDLYCRSTRFDLRLDYTRQRAWHDFTLAGFTAADLVLVVGYLRKKIAASDRNIGALRFSNLVMQLDRFEEDLAMARAESRISRRAPDPPPPGWQAWARNAYPDANIPAEFSDLPATIQAEARRACP